MVKRLIRAMLVLLLVAGAPVQGFAALGGGLCGALRHHAAQAAPISAASDQAAHAGEHHKTGDGASGAAGEAFCPSCASCGMAVATALAPAAFNAMLPGGGVAAADFPVPPGFVPEGLDRPPLTLLS